MGPGNFLRRAETAVEDAGAAVRLSAAVAIAAFVIASLALVVAVTRR